MDEKDRIRLRHIYETSVLAISFVEGKTRDDLEFDKLLAMGLRTCIGVIGEAAARISPEARQANPGLPWQDMIDMRNRLIHVYFDVNLDILWDTVTENLPQLVDKLKSEFEPGL